MKDTEKILANVKASMAVEGMKPSAFVEKLGRQLLMNTISIKEAIEKVRRHYNV
jgi:hypothetical protein